MCQIPGQTAAAPPQAGTLLQGNQAQQAEPYQGLLKMVSPRKRHSTKKRRASNYTITARVPAATRQQISSISQPPMQTQSILQVPQWPQAQAFHGAQGIQVIPAVFPPTGPFAAQINPASVSFSGAGLTNLTGLLPIHSTSQAPMPTQSILQVPQWPQAQAFQGAPGMQVIPAVFPPTGPFAAPLNPASLSFGGAGSINFAGLLPGGVCYVLLLDTKVTYTPHASPINSTILHVLTKSFDKLFTNILLI